MGRRIITISLVLLSIGIGYGQINSETVFQQIATSLTGAQTLNLTGIRNIGQSNHIVSYTFKNSGGTCGATATVQTANGITLQGSFNNSDWFTLGFTRFANTEKSGLFVSGGLYPYLRVISTGMNISANCALDVFYSGSLQTFFDSRPANNIFQVTFSALPDIDLGGTYSTFTPSFFTSTNRMEVISLQVYVTASGAFEMSCSTAFDAAVGKVLFNTLLQWPIGTHTVNSSTQGPLLSCNTGNSLYIRGKGSAGIQQVTVQYRIL